MRKIKIKVKDPSKFICENLIGENHTKTHHMMTGGVIAIVGVSVVKISLLSPFDTIHFIGETVGYVIHGIGSIPFVDHIISEIKGKNNESDPPQEDDLQT